MIESGDGIFVDVDIPRVTVAVGVDIVQNDDVAVCTNTKLVAFWTYGLSQFQMTFRHQL